MDIKLSTLRSLILVDPEASLSANPEPNTLVVDVLEGEIGISTDQIRQLVGWVGQFGFEAGEKRAIVLQAQRWSHQAPQALLKTLEEPPSGTTIILTTSHDARLPQTIRSRCATVDLADIPGEQLEAWRLYIREPVARRTIVSWAEFVRLEEAERWRTVESWHKAKMDISSVLQEWEQQALAQLRSGTRPQAQEIEGLRHLARIRQELAANASSRLTMDDLLLGLAGD